MNGEIEWFMILVGIDEQFVIGFCFIILNEV